jgi:hypothetical protein
MDWSWQRVDKAEFKRFKRTAALIDTVNGAQIWRTQSGFSRLFKEHNGYQWMSDQYFLTINEAVREASK